MMIYQGPVKMHHCSTSAITEPRLLNFCKWGYQCIRIITKFHPGKIQIDSRAFLSEWLDVTRQCELLIPGTIEVAATDGYFSPKEDRAISLTGITKVYKPQKCSYILLPQLEIDELIYLPLNNLLMSEFLLTSAVANF